MPEPVFGEDERFLLHAFRSFAETADSLERWYGSLQTEVAGLREELAQSNAGLARSRDENRAMRQHLDRILDSLPCGVMVMKAEGMIARMNPEGRRLIAWLSGSASSSFSCPRAAPAHLPAAVLEVLERARGSAGECEQEVGGGEEKAGENPGERWLAVRYAPLGENSESLAGTSESIFILRDVSEAKRLLREREKLRREQALAEMSATLAHEVRNPLGSLELFAGLLASAELPAECRGWVEHVQAGLRTLAATVNNVLHFHSLPGLERTPVDLGSLLDWARGFLAPMARQAGVNLRLKNRLQGICVAADRHRLEQVLLNLVLNAFRALPGGGRVEIGGRMLAERCAEIAEIAVSDNGPGLRAGQTERIFEPGFSTRAGSPGLGLAVCRKIVEQHGGRLEAENRARGGARFTVRLRLADESAAAAPEIAGGAAGGAELRSGASESGGSLGQI